MAEDGQKKKKEWLPLESNPEIMNPYIRKLGVQSKHRFVDIFGCDEALLMMVPQPVMAVLLNYPISEAAENHRKEEEATAKLDDGVWFTKQTVGNACGTIAILHTVLNHADELNLDESKFFHKFLTHTRDMSPEERAEALGEDDSIEAEHEEVAAAPQNASNDVNNPFNDNMHFISFTAVNGILYEFDGRKKAPINHGPTHPDTLLLDAIRVVREFMARDPEDIRFSMVALTDAEGM